MKLQTTYSDKRYFRMKRLQLQRMICKHHIKQDYISTDDITLTSFFNSIFSLNYCLLTMQDVDSVIKGSAVLHEVINTIDKHECSHK